MNKKIILTTLFLLIFVSSVFGQNASSSPTITNFEEKSIEKLKEKVADKVAEIRKKNNRAIAGKVIELSSKTIKIKTNDNEQYLVNLDETLTKYFKIFGTNQKEIKFDDLEKGDYLIVSGVINDKSITANTIFVDQPFLVDNGKIIEIDKQNYNIKVMTADKTIDTLSIETYTKQQIINIKTLEIERIGFSKIIVGDYVHFVAEVKNEENKDNSYSAKKILIIPQEYFMK